MAEIAKQIGIFMMALIIVGIPLISGLITNDNCNSDEDYDIIKTIFIMCSAVDLFIVFLLINHCI